MWEGEATTRKEQMISGIVLGLLSLPFIFIGGLTLFTSIICKGPTNTIFIVGLIAFAVGIFCSVISYRLIRARGVKKGGGILSPVVFKICGYAFVLLASAFGYWAIIEFTYGHILASVCSLAVAYFFFVAHRHRGAMRNSK